MSFFQNIPIQEIEWLIEISTKKSYIKLSKTSTFKLRAKNSQKENQSPENDDPKCCKSKCRSVLR
jgi:hypothetical protein